MKKLTIREIDRFVEKLKATETDTDAYVQSQKAQAIANLNNLCDQLEFLNRAYMKVKEEQE